MRAGWLIVIVLCVGLSQAIVPVGSSVMGSNEYCEECTQIVADIMMFFGSNSTMEELENALDVLCLLLPVDDHQECRQLVKSLIATLESTDKSWVEDYTPQQFCSVLSMCQTYCCDTPYWPQEIHISLTNDPTSIYVSWVTQLLGNTPTVLYGLSSNSLTMSTVGYSQTFTQAGWNGQIYMVKLTGLSPSTTYYYKVGDPDWEWSRVIYSFVTAPEDNVPASSDEVTFVAYGDMGSTNVANSVIYWLGQAAYTHSFDFLLHIGDISYADGYEPGFDLFLQKVEPIAAKVPYMVTAGNHEEFYDFTSYRYRFQMPTPEQNLVDVSRANMTLYYSFNYGNTHVIAISAESFWGLAPDLRPNDPQWNWLQSDLIQANANRANQPWIVVYLHRPLYCSTDDNNRCVVQAGYYRSLFEDLLYQYGVDLVLTAHVHNYERTLPVYNSTVVGNFDATTTVFVDPKAPIYAVVGTGGNKEGLQGSYVSPPPSWSVPSSRIAEWGYVQIQANGTQLTWEFHTSTDNSVLDSFTIQK